MGLLVSLAVVLGVGIPAWQHARLGAPYREPGAWVVVFQDDFNGTGLDETKWSPNYPPGSWNAGGHAHNHRGYMTEENIIVEGGLLRIKGENRRHPDAPANWTWGDASRELNWTTGAITTHGKFNFTYGYLEARQRMPEGCTGFWPAFWTIHERGSPTYGEIDVVEWLSGEATAYHVALHTRASNDSLVSTGAVVEDLPNLTATFHDYAIEWQPGTLTYYFDGRRVHEIRDPARLALLTPQAIRINLAIGGWAADPDDATTWPAWYETDWVRVWQRQ